METKKNFVINAAFYAILAVLALAFWKYLLPPLMPFVVGFLVASIVQMPLRAIHPNARWNRPAAIVLCIAFYVLLVWALAFLSTKVFAEISNFAVTVPDLFYDHLYPVIWDVGDWLQGILAPINTDLATLVNEAGKSIASTLAKYATQFSGWAVKAVASGVISIPNALVQIIVAVVSSFYIAADYGTVTAFLMKLIPGSHRGRVSELLSYGKNAVLAYVKSYTVMFFLTFAELYLGFWLMGIPYKLGLSFGIAFFDLMPILGVGGILIPWGVVSLCMGKFKMGIGAIALYLIICAVRNAVEPRIVGKQIGLHPLATLVAMMVGLNLAGLVGMLLLPISLVAVTRMRESGVMKNEE